MRTEVFIERSRLGIVVFEIKEDQVRVSGSRALQRFETVLEFHAMSHRVERLSRRFYRPVVICLGVGCLMAAMTAALLLQKRVPYGAVLYFAEVTGIFAAVFIAAGIRWLPRLEVARFKDVVGKIAFDVVKERRYSEEFEDFVALLQVRIAEGKSPTRR